MPGIWGVCAAAQDIHDADLGQRMPEALRHSDVYETSVARSGQLLAGAVTLPDVKQPTWFRPDAGLPLVVVDGEIYDADRHRRELSGAGREFQTDSAAELLAHGWSLRGSTFLRDLDGYFSAAIWEPAQERLSLVNDRFGMRPLYYATVEGVLLFASEIKALMQYSRASARPSLRGVAQFLTFGHLFGEDTLIDAVRTLPAAAEITYHAPTRKLRVGSYHVWRQGPLIRDEREALPLLDESFGRAVVRRTGGTLPLGLSLSGGLDARTILAAVPKSLTSLKTLSLGIPGSIDHRAAARLSELGGHEHHVHHLGQNFLERFPQYLECLTYLTDGQYLDQAITVPTLGIYRQLGIRVLLRGHAGELFHMDKAYAFSIRASELGFRTVDEVESWLWAHLTPYMIEGVGMTMFRPHLRKEAESAARQALHDALAEAASFVPVAQALWVLFVTQRLRRETALSMQMFNAFVQVRMPYVDAELIDLVMRVPPELKIGERIQGFILKQHFPAFLDVVNSNTGSPIGAGQLARSLSQLRLKVFSKLRVPGYQPYERLGLWLRRELQPFVRSVLLAPEALDRGLLDETTVRQMIDDHAADRRNHTFPLMAMLIFEIGQRQLANPPQRAREAVKAAWSAA